MALSKAGCDPASGSEMPHTRSSTSFFPGLSRIRLYSSLLWSNVLPSPHFFISSCTWSFKRVGGSGLFFFINRFSSGKRKESKQASQPASKKENSLIKSWTLFQRMQTFRIIKAWQLDSTFCKLYLSHGKGAEMGKMIREAWRAELENQRKPMRFGENHEISGFRTLLHLNFIRANQDQLM